MEEGQKLTQDFQGACPINVKEAEDHSDKKLQPWGLNHYLLVLRLGQVHLLL